MFESLPHLSSNEENTIFLLEFDHHTIKVFEDDTYRWMTLGGDCIQSITSVSNPQQILLPYTQSMLLALAFTQKPHNLLNLGSGCGTFERFLLQHYPETLITSVELDTHIIEISRQFFYTPPEHPVLNISAEHFLKSNKTKYDIIFCDLHDGTKHPDFFYDTDFYYKIFNSLSEKGTFAINLLADNEKYLLKILLSMRKVFRWQHLLEFDNYGNVLVYLHKQKPRISSSDEIIKELKERKNIDLTHDIDKLTLLPFTI